MIRRQDKATNSKQLSEAHDQGRHNECREGSLNLLSNPRIPRWTRIQTLQMLSTLLQPAGAERYLLEVEEWFRQMDMTKSQNQLLQDDNNKMLADLRRWQKKRGLHGSLEGVGWDHGDVSGEEVLENSATDGQLQEKVVEEKEEEMEPSGRGTLAVHTLVDQPSRSESPTGGKGRGGDIIGHSAGPPGNAPTTPTGRDLRHRFESSGVGDGASQRSSRDDIRADASSARCEQQAWAGSKRAELEARQRQLELELELEKDALAQLVQLEDEAREQEFHAFELEAHGQQGQQTRLDPLQQISEIQRTSAEDRSACMAALEPVEEQIRAWIAKRDGVTLYYEQRKATREAEIECLQQKLEDMAG